jgi:hypothetical protein
MKQYMLSVYHPDTDGDGPLAEALAESMQRVDALNDELQAAGAWVFAGGLHPSSTATVVRFADGDLLSTDGPFVESKEHIGGFWVIQAADLDAALAWGAKATEACALPVEVRPFMDNPGS